MTSENSHSTTATTVVWLLFGVIAVLASVRITTVDVPERLAKRRAFEYRNDGPLERSSDGDRVVGIVWRGQVVKIASKGTGQVTGAGPTDLSEAAVSLAIACGPSGVLLVIACVWRLRRRSEPSLSRPMMCVVLLSLCLAVVAIAAGVLVTALQAPVWLVPGMRLPAAAAMTWYAVRTARKPHAETAAPEQP